MKNIGITCVFSNPQYARTTPRGLELICLKKIFDNKGIKSFIFGNKCRTNKDLSFFIDISKIEDCDLDSIFLQLAPANFFGGQYSDYSVTAVEKLSNIWKKGNTVFNILPTDPRIKPLNPAKILNDRFGICGEHIETWNDIIKNSNYLFPGKDINKFWKMDIDFKVVKFDWFKEIFKQTCDISNFVDSGFKDFDVVYYGDKRGSYRNNNIKKLMPTSTSNLLLGYKEKKIKATFKKKVKHVDLLGELNKCKVSLVIADKEHEDNVVTFRFYEALASSCLAAIDINFDPNKELIKDPKLKELLYVKDSKDVERLVSLYSEELIELQQAELKRIFNGN